MPRLVRKLFSLNFKQRFKSRRRRRSNLILLLVLVIWSALLGWGLDVAARSPTPPALVANIGTVDPTPERYQLGEQLYVENCSGCHIPLPPAVLPTSTWRDLLLDEEHYGTRVAILPEPEIQIVWNYLQIFSRPTDEGEETPYRMDVSRYFRALHPGVEIERPVSVRSCASCHPNVAEFDFRSLTSQWQ